MRLSQLDNKHIAEATPKLPNKPSKEDSAALQQIMHEMHRTMLVADQLMRKLEIILEKY